MDNNTVFSLSRLSFHEANILMENMRENQEQAAFISRLDTLAGNTEDPVLLRELETLIFKVKRLTPTEFRQLYQDTKTGKVFFPHDYPLPCSIDEFSI